MKKISIIFCLISLFAFSTARSQSFDLGVLDNALSIVKSGDQGKLAGVLGGAMIGLQSEAKSSTSDFGPKILSQVGGLAKMLPMLKSGKADLGAIQKIINTVKMLVAANRLSGLLKSGNLSQNKSGLLSNVSTLKSGLGLLEGAKGVKKISKVLDLVTKKSDKLDLGGRAGKIAQKVITKKLRASLGKLSGLL